MVKFAEAEKRRGGEGGDRKTAPVMMLERPKISRATWESLRAHIMRERRRKKEELEANEEEKRMRKERENRKKQHAMTLEETREQLQKHQEKLVELKAQKDELVQQLKKVVQEQQQQQQQQQQASIQAEQQHQRAAEQHNQQHQTTNFVKEGGIVPVHAYPHSAIPLGNQHQMMFPASIVPGRGGNIPTLYKVGVPSTQSLSNVISSSSMKRSRSPSPPPPPPPAPHNYQQIPYVFKSIPGTQTSVVPVTLTTSKPGTTTSIYLSGQGGYYHGSSQPSQNTSSQYPPPQTSQAAAVVAPYLTTPPGPPPLSNSQPTVSHPSREDKHMQPSYLSSSRAPVAHVASLHQAHDHKGKPPSSGGGFVPPSESGQDKFLYRPQLVLHTAGGVLPVQQPSGPGKGTSISSFPVRAPQPTSTSQPPPHSGSGSVPHTYSSHSASITRNYF